MSPQEKSGLFFRTEASSSETVRSAFEIPFFINVIVNKLNNLFPESKIIIVGGSAMHLALGYPHEGRDIDFLIEGLDANKLASVEIQNQLTSSFPDLQLRVEVGSVDPGKISLKFYNRENMAVIHILPLYNPYETTSHTIENSLKYLINNLARIEFDPQSSTYTLVSNKHLIEAITGRMVAIPYQDHGESTEITGILRVIEYIAIYGKTLTIDSNTRELFSNFWLSYAKLQTHKCFEANAFTKKMQNALEKIQENDARKRYFLLLFYTGALTAIAPITLRSFADLIYRVSPETNSVFETIESIGGFTYNNICQVIADRQPEFIKKAAQDYFNGALPQDWVFNYDFNRYLYLEILSKYPVKLPGLIEESSQLTLGDLLGSTIWRENTNPNRATLPNIRELGETCFLYFLAHGIQDSLSYPILMEIFSDKITDAVNRALDREPPSFFIDRAIDAIISSVVRDYAIFLDHLGLAIRCFSEVDLKDLSFSERVTIFIAACISDGAETWLPIIFSGYSEADFTTEEVARLESILGQENTHIIILYASGRIQEIPEQILLSVGEKMFNLYYVKIFEYLKKHTAALQLYIGNPSEHP